MATEIIKLPPFNNGDILGGIFKYQENLMLEYIGMDMLSPFPIELNNRESQRFMKGLIGDIIEELVEANNHYRTEILEFYNEWGHAVIPGSPAFNVEQYQKLREGMAGYAEELSDVLHFMVELLIYSNIGVKEVEEYYQKKAPELFINATSSCFNYSKSKMAYNREYTAIKFQSYRVLTVMEAKDDVKDDYPGNFISPEVFFIMRSLSYDLVESLKMASHKLKMKYWKQEDVYTSAFDFQNQIMDSFEKLFDYLVFVGMSEKRLYLSYEAKNLKNQQRLKDGY